MQCHRDLVTNHQAEWIIPTLGPRLPWQRAVHPHQVCNIGLFDRKMQVTRHLRWILWNARAIPVPVLRARVLNQPDWRQFAPRLVNITDLNGNLTVPEALPIIFSVGSKFILEGSVYEDVPALLGRQIPSGFLEFLALRFHFRFRIWWLVGAKEQWWQETRGAKPFRWARSAVLITAPLLYFSVKAQGD